MPIELIDKIKQKNNGSFKLMDAQDVQYDDTGMSVKEKLDELETGEGNEIITEEEIASLFE